MKNSRSKRVVFGVSLCAAGLIFAHAPAARAAVADADRDYVRQAAQEVIGDAEINRIARDKAEHEEVRRFADKRVKLDEKIESELRDVADRHHIGVPGRDELVRDAKDRLEHVRNAEHFDREYLSGEVRDSEEMTRLFKSASKGEGDREMRTWYDDKVHTLQDSHDEVKTLDDRFDK